MNVKLAMKILAIATRNVARNWRHSLASLAAIAAGFTAIALFDGFLIELVQRNHDGFKIRGMMGDVVIQRQGAQHHLDEDFWAYALTGEELDFLDRFLAKERGVRTRVRFLNVAGLINAGPNNGVFTGHGFDVKEGAKLRGERWQWNTVAGHPLHETRGDSILLGQGLGRLLDCASTYEGPSYLLPAGNYRAEVRPFTCKSSRVSLSATTEAGQINAIDLNVVGLIDAGFREADKRAVSLSLEQAQRLLDTDKATLVSVQLQDASQSAAFIQSLRKASREAGYLFDVMRWDEHRFADYVRGGLEILQVFRNLFMTVVVTIGVMSVTNTMMKAVSERTREIGTLRSCGFRRHHLQMIFALEGAFLSLLACGIGLASTVVISWCVGALGLTYRAGILSAPIQLEIAWAPAAWAFSAILLSTLATGTAWICARRAARMNIADAMRHV